MFESIQSHIDLIACPWLYRNMLLVYLLKHRFMFTCVHLHPIYTVPYGFQDQFNLLGLKTTARLDLHV